MKLYFIVALSLLSFYSCTGYPITERKCVPQAGESVSPPGAQKNGELPEGLENATFPEYRLDSSNETTSNDSSQLEMHGNKVIEKVKEGIKTVKDKLKDGYDKVKDKVKGGFDKVKDKIKDFKDKIGSKGGGGSGGGYYRDKYDRDYDRDYYRKDSDYSGGGSVHPDAQKIALGIGIVIGGGGLLFVIIMKLRDISKRNSRERTRQ